MTLPVCGWMVTDEHGDTALFKAQGPAERYATKCTRGGILDAMVKRRDHLAALAEAGCRPDSDEKGS